MRKGSISQSILTDEDRASLLAALSEDCPDHRAAAMKCCISVAALEAVMADGILNPGEAPNGPFASEVLRIEGTVLCSLYAATLKAAKEKGQSEVLRKLLDARIGPESPLARLEAIVAERQREQLKRVETFHQLLRARNPGLVKEIARAGFELVELGVHRQPG